MENNINEYIINLHYESLLLICNLNKYITDLKIKYSKEKDNKLIIEEFCHYTDENLLKRLYEALDYYNKYYYHSNLLYARFNSMRNTYGLSINRLAKLLINYQISLTRIESDLRTKLQTKQLIKPNNNSYTVIELEDNNEEYSHKTVIDLSDVEEELELEFIIPNKPSTNVKKLNAFFKEVEY